MPCSKMHLIINKITLIQNKVSMVSKASVHSSTFLEGLDESVPVASSAEIIVNGVVKRRNAQKSESSRKSMPYADSYKESNCEKKDAPSHIDSNEADKEASQIKGKSHDSNINLSEDELHQDDFSSSSVSLASSYDQEVAYRHEKNEKKKLGKLNKFH